MISIIFATRDNPKAEIIGKGRVEEWPTTIHLCMRRPVRITEATLIAGLQIRRVPYRIKGIIHCRGQGEWHVSVERDGDWQILGRESYTGREALLSDIVVVQLIRDNVEDSTTVQGLHSHFIKISYVNSPKAYMN